MKNLISALSLLSVVVVAGCGSGEKKPDETNEPNPTETPDPADDPCKRGEIESDLVSMVPLSGPGVDPETGELKPPPAAGYIVSSTYLRLKSKPGEFQRFGELMGPIQQALAEQPGLLALQLSTSDSCSSARTLAVWESADAMYEFVTSPAHMAAVDAVGEVSRGGSIVTSWRASQTGEATWDEAVRKLDADNGPFY